MGLPVHLSATDIEEFGKEIDAIRDEIMATRGAPDRAYILRMIRLQRALDLGARALFLGCALTLPVLELPWASQLVSMACLALGVALLTLAKTLENMEIGHNVMHAQWDWMHDPGVHSSAWEWDSFCPSELWKHSHNVVHHTWTNVIGRDPDVGYAVLRVTPRQAWHVKFLPQALWHVLLAVLFDWGVAIHDLDPEKLATGQRSLASIKPLLRSIGRKISRQLLKDYVLWPGLALVLVSPAILRVGELGAARHMLASTYGTLALGIWIANVMRNVWSNLVVFCGHFPLGVYHFTEQDLVGETRARWYVRQLLGSCNIRGSRWLHILTGNLSHQIEHHLYPDMPSNRYAEIAPRIAAIAARYGLPYNTGSFARQLGRTLWTIWRFSLPGGEVAQPELAGASAARVAAGAAVLAAPAPVTSNGEARRRPLQDEALLQPRSPLCPTSRRGLHSSVTRS